MNKQQNRIERHVTFTVLLLLLSMLLSACGSTKYTCGLCQKEYTGTPKDYSGMKLCNQCYSDVTSIIGEPETAVTAVADNTAAPMGSKIFAGSIYGTYPFVNGYAVIGGWDKYADNRPTGDYKLRIIDANGTVVNPSGIVCSHDAHVYPPDNGRLLVGDELYDYSGMLIQKFANVKRIGAPSDGMLFVQEKVKKISGDAYDLVYYNTDGIEEFRFTDGTEPIGTPSDMHSGVAFVVNNGTYSMVTKDGDVTELIVDTAENRELAKGWIVISDGKELVDISEITVKSISGGSNSEKYFGCTIKMTYTKKDSYWSDTYTTFAPAYITIDGIVHIIPSTGFAVEQFRNCEISLCVYGCVIVNNRYIYNVASGTLFDVLQSDICQAAGGKSSSLRITFIDDGNYLITVSLSNGNFTYDEWCSVITADGLTISAPVFMGSHSYYRTTSGYTSSSNSLYGEHEDTYILNSSALYSYDKRDYYDVYGNKVLAISGEPNCILDVTLPSIGGVLGFEKRARITNERQNLVIIDAEGGITPILVP